MNSVPHLWWAVLSTILRQSVAFLNAGGCIGIVSAHNRIVSAHNRIVRGRDRIVRGRDRVVILQLLLLPFQDNT